VFLVFIFLKINQTNRFLRYFNPLLTRACEERSDAPPDGLKPTHLILYPQLNMDDTVGDRSVIHVTWSILMNWWRNEAVCILGRENGRPDAGRWLNAAASNVVFLLRPAPSLASAIPRATATGRETADKKLAPALNLSGRFYLCCLLIGSKLERVQNQPRHVHVFWRPFSIEVRSTPKLLLFPNRSTMQYVFHVSKHQEIVRGFFTNKSSPSQISRDSSQIRWHTSTISLSMKRHIFLIKSFISLNK
jgi:hypothetical protein